MYYQLWSMTTADYTRKQSQKDNYKIPMCLKINKCMSKKKLTIETVLSYLIMEILNLGMQIREKFIGLNVYIEKEEKLKCYEPRKKKKTPEKIEKNLRK